MQGMLAHSRRYGPRAEDKDLHWHDAMAREAFDLAEAVRREDGRRYKQDIVSKPLVADPKYGYR